jgi:general secretion pathway protein G
MTRRRGFTLVEVLLVLLILAGLATVAVVAVGNSREQAKVDQTRTIFGIIESALEKYNNAIGHYPTEDEGGLQALRVKPSFEEDKVADRWRSPFLAKDEQLRDAWGNEIQYEVTTDDTSGVSVEVVRLTSPGPDEQEGTEDDIRNYDEEGM